MYGSETFATDVSSTSIKVASMMETAINHGLKLGFQSSGSDAAVSALMLAPFEPGRSTAPPRKLHQPLQRPPSSRLRTRPDYHAPWLPSDRRTCTVQARV